MKRAVPALALLAAVTALVAAPTMSTFSQTSPNTSNVTSAASFAPVAQPAPTLVFAGASLLSGTLTLTQGNWGYVHSNGASVDTSGEPTPSLSDQWQWCQSGTCHDFANATNPLQLTGALLTSIGINTLNLTGVTFQVVETADNGITTATATAVGS